MVQVWKSFLHSTFKHPGLFSETFLSISYKLELSCFFFLQTQTEDIPGSKMDLSVGAYILI